jgi:pantetheine-phosphate adenylyltransferase
MTTQALSSRIAETFPVHLLSSPCVIEEVSARWCERQRYCHGPDHLLVLIDAITARTSGADREVLLLSALYHDAVYNPRAADNEERSARLLRMHGSEAAGTVVDRACEIIMASTWKVMPEEQLGRLFFELDTWQLSDACPLSERVLYERAIFREFQFAPWEEYREKRGAFLKGWAERFPQHQSGVRECTELLRGLQPRVAVYPGSFHPLHHGHLSILRQAEPAFDKVILAVGVNRQKLAATDSLEARLAAVQTRMLFHEVRAFSGLLSEFLDGLGLPVTVVRGVRDGTDLEAELRYARFLNELRPGTSVIWIGCEPELQHVSSSAIRELEAIQPGAGERYVPDTRRIYQLGDPID